MYKKLIGITNTSVTSVDLQNIFTDDFSVYEINLHTLENSGDNKHMRFRFYDSSNAVISDGEYSYDYHNYRSDNESWSYNQASETDTSGYLGFFGGKSSAGSVMTIHLFNPKSSSHKTTFICEANGYATTPYTRVQTVWGGHNNAEEITGIQFYETASSSFVTFGVAVYGIG